MIHLRPNKRRVIQHRDRSHPIRRWVNGHLFQRGRGGVEAQEADALEQIAHEDEITAGVEVEGHDIARKAAKRDDGC